MVANNDAAHLRVLLVISAILDETGEGQNLRSSKLI